MAISRFLLPILKMTSIVAWQISVTNGSEIHAWVRVQHLAQRVPCAQYARSAYHKSKNLYRNFSIKHLDLFKSEIAKVQTKVPRD